MALRNLSLFAAAVALSACSITPEPMSDAEKTARIAADRLVMFQDTEPVTGPVGLDEAMARAVKYNLDHRVELMSAAVAQAQLNLAHYDLLPKLTAAAGYSSRSNSDASSSISLETKRESLERAGFRGQPFFRPPTLRSMWAHRSTYKPPILPGTDQPRRDPPDFIGDAARHQSLGRRELR
ncbi:MAG: hypothetical protein GC191_10670 [Azospirillum sp.]|nr:hypothetical protein [Azospirillum sp.]